MKRIANYFQLESGFIIESHDDLVSLRYAVPNYEMEMCVHATIGSIQVISDLNKNRFQNYQIKTKLGTIIAEIRLDNQKNIIFVNQFKPVFFDKNPSSKEICTALNIPESDINLDLGPIQSVSSSRPKLIIPLTDYKVLSSLNPNYEYLWSICEKYNTTGFYPFTINTRKEIFDVEARQFPKNAGYPEDPATGVAAGALSSYLTNYTILPTCRKKNTFKYKIGQGIDMKRPSIIYTENKVESNEIAKVLVGGEAEIVKKEHLTIEANEITTSLF